VSLFDGKPLEPEDIPEDDDICPECGANWADGEYCDEDCDVQANYEAEEEEYDE